jgi:FecR protein
MNNPRYAAAAARLLSRHLPRAPGQLLEPSRSLSTIDRALRARARRRAAFITVASLSVAAAAALAFFTLGKPGEDAATVSISVASAGEGVAIRASGTAQRISRGAELVAGQQLETASDGGATLRLSTGTDLTLAGRTSFRVDSQGKDERFSLERGELVAHVAKLTEGRRFVVDTPDAEVEVRGTRFRLRVVDATESCGAGSRTRLEVTEGVVEVRPAGAASQRIVAGQRWPADCSPPRDERAAPPPAAPSAAVSSTVHHHPSPTSGAAPATTVPARPPAAPPVDERESSLALQNDLFARGVASRRQGDVGGALRAYEELIRRFPRSPLAENAMVERLRLFSSGGDARAADEARRYLARYPRGFAVAEARRALEER